jgi:hypothetical protein
MASPDPRGNPCGTRSPAARDAAEQALWRMMSFYDTPLADLDAASEADPGWALPHVMRCGFLLSLTEAAMQREAATHLQRATELSAGAPARERAHIDAMQLLLEGRWRAACSVWDRLLVDYPRDALALQWARSRRRAWRRTRCARWRRAPADARAATARSPGRARRRRRTAGSGSSSGEARGGRRPGAHGFERTFDQS